MAERMVALKSMVNAIVTIKKPEFGINKKWQKRGQILMMPFDVVEQLLWDNSVRNMIDSGILYIENLKDKIDLGLEPADATEPENIIALSINDLENYWTQLPIDVFKRKVVKLPKIQVDNLISYGIETEHINVEKCLFLKELTKGKDVLAAISRKHEIEEFQRQEAEGKRDFEGRR